MLLNISPPFTLMAVPFSRLQYLYTVPFIMAVALKCSGLCNTAPINSYLSVESLLNVIVHSGELITLSSAG